MSTTVSKDASLIQCMISPSTTNHVASHEVVAILKFHTIFENCIRFPTTAHAYLLNITRLLDFMFLYELIHSNLIGKKQISK